MQTYLMEVRKDMQNLLTIVGALFEDASSLTTASSKRDLATALKRVQHEGLSFLTITLPKFGSDCFRAIELGYVASDLFLGWKKRLCLPAFMSGFTKLVFDAHTGRILDEPNVQAIYAIRQVCFFFKKIKLPCSAARNTAALEKYVLTDKALDCGIKDLNYDEISLFAEVSNLVVNSLFYDYKHSDILVHHGPGATADQRKGNRKYLPRDLKVPRRLTRLLPIGDGFLFNTEESYNKYKYDVAFTHTSTVSVTLVPKTQTTPRVIAMEPTAVLMMQQGIKDYLVDRIESHWLTKGHVNFTDQGINQKLALKSSITRNLATLDLSEASDRVHNELIKLMFDSNPELLEALQLTRSEFAKVAGFRKRIVLNKYASMGSALCFPIESLFFYVILLCSRIISKKKREAVSHLPITIKLLKELTGGVFVYGDDLIVPTDEVQDVITTLSQFGNVVGVTKSYYNSYFRESCGVDAWKGKDITPIYLRELPAITRSEVSNLISNVATANLLFDKGFWCTANVLRLVVEQITGRLPQFDSAAHEGLGWMFGEFCDWKRRYNPNLQRLEVRTLVPTLIYKPDKLNGYPALFKCMLALEIRSLRGNRSIQEPISSAKSHLKETVVRYVTKLKRSWVPAN